MMRRGIDPKNGKLAVSSITGMYVGKAGSTYYQVQWSPSWESEDNIVGCEKMIQEFHIRQEKEIFGGAMNNNNKPTSEDLDGLKTTISNEINELRNTLKSKLDDLEGLIVEQQACNEEFSRRLGVLEESTAYTSSYYFDPGRRQTNNIPEAEMGNVQVEDISNRDKDDENNELYFEDMLYNDYIEDSMEPRRKKSRGDIAVGIPVNVDSNLTTKIKERLQATNCLQKESEVLHAVRVCNVRHILALKLAQIIFSNAELASASYAPGNFKPLDGVKLSLIEDISFMRFKTDESEVKEVSWGQIHQRIKNKCRCKRKEYNDKLSNTSGGNFKITSVFSGNTPIRDKTNNVSQKFPMSYSMAAADSKYPSNYQGSSSEGATVTSPGKLDLSHAYGNPLSNLTDRENTSPSHASDAARSSTNNEQETEVTIICKEDESDYTDES